VLAQARVSFGVTLGHLLPENRWPPPPLDWPGVRLALDLGDRTLLASVLRMHAMSSARRHAAAALTRLRNPATNDIPPPRATLVLLARAAAESGRDLFDAVTDSASGLEDREGHEVFFNALRRSPHPRTARHWPHRKAVDWSKFYGRGKSAYPQWRVIERYHCGCARQGRRRHAAVSMLSAPSATRNATPAASGPANRPPNRPVRGFRNQTSYAAQAALTPGAEAH